MENPCGFAGRRPTTKRHFKRPRNNDCEEEVRMLFEKKFRFEPPADGAWTLPHPDLLFTAEPWTVKSLQVEKSRLNLHKSQLNDLRIEEWSWHTKRRNPAGDISRLLRQDTDPEFLTQAWTKFYECAYQYDIVPISARGEGRLVSLHLCEAPGAFVTALNHYLKLHHPDIHWEWTASTLNPYYEGNSPSNMISDDRFMWHTLGRWNFGRDHTGDLTCWGNSQSIVRSATLYSQAHLVTADGSIDCLQRPDAQEELTSPLHYCEVVTALQALATGGTFICKLFTMFEHSTINLLYLLNIVFQEVYIYKPVTSKAGNSEVYAVCLHYAGVDRIMPYIDKLQAGFGTKLYEEKSLFPLDAIPEEFIRQILNCSKIFCYMQCDIINKNLEAFLQKNFNCPKVKSLRGLVATSFMQFYNITPITHKEEILKGLMHTPQKVNTNPRYQRGSYTQRQNFECMSAAEKYLSLEEDFGRSSQQEWMMLRENTINWYELYDKNYSVDLELVHGRTLTTIKSSKFVFTPILNQFRRLSKEAGLENSTIAVSPMSIEQIAKEYDVKVEGWKILTLPEVDLYDYEWYNRKCLELIVDSLDGFREGDVLYLPNFDILSHTSVGILFILCKACFCSIGFTNGNGLVLRNFIENGKVDSLREILKQCERSEKDCKSVLRVLPVSVTNEGDFFNTVLCYNNTVYTKKSIHLLSNLKRIYDGEKK